MARALPIVYVRGFGGGQSGIDALVEDPFYGFNVGSTHVRVGARGEPRFYQFESPLLRLMLDHGYQLEVKGGQLAWLRSQPDGEVPEASIWIHRFYDDASSTYGKAAQDYRLERAAEDLFDFVELVRRKTSAPRVFLVAHSMGGLICRSMIQKVIPEKGKEATEYVDRLFTYATPPRRNRIRGRVRVAREDPRPVRHQRCRHLRSGTNVGVPQPRRGWHSADRLGLP